MNTTEQLLQCVEKSHDWDKGEVSSSGGTRLSSTDKCRICGLKREWFSDRQNEIYDDYTFRALSGEELSLREVSSLPQCVAIVQPDAFVAVEQSVLHGSKCVARACSHTYARRIARALNNHQVNEKGY